MGIAHAYAPSGNRWAGLEGGCRRLAPQASRVNIPAILGMQPLNKNDRNFASDTVQKTCHEPPALLLRLASLNRIKSRQDILKAGDKLQHALMQWQEVVCLSLLDLGCGRAMASRKRARSGTFLAIGPETACTRSCPTDAASPAKFWGTRPTEGLRPTTPQKEAGMRREPPRSEPVASHTWHNRTQPTGLRSQ